MKIAKLNDELRSNYVDGHWLVTAGVLSLPPPTVARALDTTMKYDNWAEKNDPYFEHDFGGFEVDGVGFYFKIDYYNLDMTAGSPDPANPAVTKRVLTLMLRSEY